MKYWKPNGKVKTTSDFIRALKPGRVLNEAALVEYIKYQYYTDDETLFKGIFRERPANLAGYAFTIGDLTPEGYIARVEKAIFDAVERCFDNPSYREVCFMASGGIDSSLVAAMGTQCFSQRRETFTGFFTEPGYNEIEYVKALARLYPKLAPVFIPIGQYDFVDNIRAVIKELEEPCGGPGSFSQWMVYKEVVRHGVNTLLTGEGGDELFGGYDRYNDLDNYPNKVWRYNLPIYDLPIDINERGTRPASRKDAMYQEVRYDLPTLLMIDEKLPMALGFESKAPMICDEVIDLSREIPESILFTDGQLKWVLKQIAKKWLPELIATRTNKMGFPTPFVKWLKEGGPVRDFFLDTMNSQSARERGIYKADWEQAIGQESEYGRTLWGALSIELWFEEYMD